MKPKISRILGELRKQLDVIYGQRLASPILFGSQARGDAAPASDVDVLVVLEGDVDPGKEIAQTGKAITALSLGYDAVIWCVFVSTKRYASEQTPLLLNVRNEGVIV
jgi:predicted nucleotidyltransferase